MENVIGKMALLMCLIVELKSGISMGNYIGKMDLQGNMPMELSIGGSMVKNLLKKSSVTDIRLC